MMWIARPSRHLSHLEGVDDDLVIVSPLLDLVADWNSYLSLSTEAELVVLQRHERTGRPLGNNGFVDRLEKRLGRILRPQKPGPRNKQNNS